MSLLRRGARWLGRFLINRLGKVIATPVRWKLNAFEAATHHPEEVQQALLRRLLDHQTEAGTPCGAVTGLTARMQWRIIRWLYCVPPCVGEVKDVQAKYYLALRLSLPRRVALVIAANPSTLINLARQGDRDREFLIR